MQTTIKKKKKSVKNNAPLIRYALDMRKNKCAAMSWISFTFTHAGIVKSPWRMRKGLWIYSEVKEKYDKCFFF